MKRIRVKTPAKVNLTLEVVGTREDGFHEIQSIMQAVDLYDYITIAVEKSEHTHIRVSGTSDKIPYDHNNIAYVAAEKFLKEVGNYFVEIYIEKNIPVKAGMAGGSANAAGVLYGLNKLLGNPFASEELLTLATEIGSDVPFCLFGGTQMATSRGEALKKVSTPEIKILGIKPHKLAVSAQEAYGLYDKINIQSKRNATFNMLMALSKKTNILPYLHNDLEFPVIREYPQVKQLKDYMLNLGCSTTLMSGSGPVVFGVLDKDIPCPENLQADCFIAETIRHGVRVI